MKRFVFFSLALFSSTLIPYRLADPGAGLNRPTPNGRLQAEPLATTFTLTTQKYTIR